MTKLARAALVLLIPAAALLAGCAPEPADEIEPAPTSPVGSSAPTVAPAALPEGAAIAEWAAIALPEDRAGAPAAVIREVGPISRTQGVDADIAQAAGAWDLVLACQSVDGAPLAWHIESPSAATEEPFELDCTTPNGGVPTTSVVAFDGPGARLELTATSDAVYAYEVRPHSDLLD